MLANHLFEWDHTSFTTGAKNWLTRQGDEWLGTPDAIGRHNVRLAANKIYSAWRIYVAQNALQGTNVELAAFISRYYGEDKIAALNNLVPNLLPATPPPPARQTATPGTTEGRRLTGRLVEAPPNTNQTAQPQQAAQAAQAAQPAQPAQPAAPAQPAQPAAVVLSRAQVDQLFVALGRIMLDSGEAQPGMKQRPQKGGYEGGGTQGSGGGGGTGRKISELTNIKISATALDYAEKSTRAKLTDANHILALIKNNMQPTIAELVKKYPVSGENMLVLLAAAQAS